MNSVTTQKGIDRELNASRLLRSLYVQTQLPNYNLASHCWDATVVHICIAIPGAAPHGKLSSLLYGRKSVCLWPVKPQVCLRNPEDVSYVQFLQHATL